VRRGVHAIALATLLLGCSGVGLELDRQRAIDKGLPHVGGPVDAVVSAVWTPTLPDGSAPPAPDRGVWRIEFRTSFEEPCGPPPVGGIGPANMCRVERVAMYIGSTTGTYLGGDREGGLAP
jgi:hypothetical protein